MVQMEDHPANAGCASALTKAHRTQTLTFPIYAQDNAQAEGATSLQIVQTVRLPSAVVDLLSE